MPTPSKVDLICVDPARITDFWPLARDYIRAAIEKTQLTSFESVERDVLAGDQLLWLAVGNYIEAAATTHLSNRVCTLIACGGHQRERWLPLFKVIEDYAKAEGCRCVRIFGRKGWERALDGYRVSHVVLERSL